MGKVPRRPRPNMAEDETGETTPLVHPSQGEIGGGGHHGVGGGSVWGSTFNLCNSAIGAGILALPYAVKETGLGLGVVLLVVMCLVLAFDLKIIIWTNRLHISAKSYEQLVLSLFGKSMSILVTFSVILTTFGACAGFLVIIADLMCPLIELITKDPTWLYDRKFVTAVISVIGILPLASLKNFNSLRFSSACAIISVTFTVFVIIFRSAQNLPNVTRASVDFFELGFGIFDALPLISFAFGCHMQIVPIYAELKDNHIPSRVNWVIIATNTVCLTLYAFTGVFGYLEFGPNTTGNILKNYPANDVLVNIARAALSFVIVCHYPPSNYCCRGALDYLFFNSARPSTIRRLCWTFVIWGFAFLFAIKVPRIEVVFGLIGATANSLIVFIFPAFFLIKCCKRKDWEGIRGFKAQVIGVLIFALGIIITCLGTVIIVLTTWFPDKIPHPTPTPQPTSPPQAYDFFKFN